MRPDTRRIWVAVGAVAAAGAALTAGVAPVRALVVAVVVAAVGVVLTETRSPQARWPAPLSGPAHSAWTEVDHVARILAAADSDPEWFDRVVRGRLRGLATDVLNRHGVPWTDPRAADLVGEQLWQDLEGLRGAPRAGLPRAELVPRTLTALRAIDPRLADPEASPTAGPTTGPTTGPTGTTRPSRGARP